jgi:hypothetical protein
MSREIPEDQPLSKEDRQYLEQRAEYQRIRRIDELNGGETEPEPDTEDGLARQISDLEVQLTDLRGRHTQLRIAREQEEARVRDNTVVDGEGGSDNRSDEYDDMTKVQLAEEISRRNDDRDEDEQISPNGTKAQLIERLRAVDAEEDEDDEDDD